MSRAVRQRERRRRKGRSDGIIPWGRARIGGSSPLWEERPFGLPSSGGREKGRRDELRSRKPGGKKWKGKFETGRMGGVLFMASNH